MWFSFIGEKNPYGGMSNIEYRQGTPDGAKNPGRRMTR